METVQTTAAIALFGTMVVINSDAAVGASFGAAFFMLSAHQFTLVMRMFYTVISAGFGYGLAVGVGGDWVMITGIIGAAGAIAVLDSMMKGSEPTAFVKWVLDTIRGRK